MKISSLQGSAKENNKCCLAALTGLISLGSIGPFHPEVTLQAPEKPG